GPLSACRICDVEEVHRMEDGGTTGDATVLWAEDAERQSPGEKAGEAIELSKGPSLSRWMLQFGVGVLVAGGLVLGIGRRAELSDRILLARARQAMQSGHSYQAARDLEAAHKKQPGDRAVQVALIEAYYRSGAPESA